MGDYTQVIITIVGVLGSGAVWKYMEARLKSKTDQQKYEQENNDGVQYRDDLKHRVRNLEALLARNGEEKDELRSDV